MCRNDEWRWAGCPTCCYYGVFHNIHGMWHWLHITATFSSPPFSKSMRLPALNSQFPFGIQAAACARVGNALGAGDNTGALLTSRVALTLAGQLCIIIKTILKISLSDVINFFPHLQAAFVLLKALCLAPPRQWLALFSLQMSEFEHQYPQFSRTGVSFAYISRKNNHWPLLLGGSYTWCLSWWLHTASYSSSMVLW